MVLKVIREEMSERHLVGTDRDPVPTCKVFVRSVVGMERKKRVVNTVYCSNVDGNGVRGSREYK